MLWETRRYPSYTERDQTAPEPTLDRDRKVTLTVGQLTDAIAEALKVVSDAPEPPKFKVGDLITLSARVTGVNRETVNFTLVGTEGSDRKDYALNASLLSLIQDAA